MIVETLAAQFTSHPDLITPLCDHDGHATRSVVFPGHVFAVFDADRYEGCTGNGVYCPGDDPVSRQVMAAKMWEVHITAVAEAILGSGRTGIMVDAGTCIGWFTALAAMHGRDTLGLEMVAEFAHLARSNAANVRGDETTVVVQVYVCAATPPVTVDEPVVLMKVDTEGSEAEVVRVFDQAFRDGLVRYAILEISPVFNDSYPALIRHLFSYGYSCSRIAPDGTFHVWTLDNLDASIAEFTQCDVVCAAPGMPVLW